MIKLLMKNTAADTMDTLLLAMMISFSWGKTTGGSSYQSRLADNRGVEYSYRDLSVYMNLFSVRESSFQIVYSAVFVALGQLSHFPKRRG